MRVTKFVGLLSVLILLTACAPVAGSDKDSKAISSESIALPDVSSSTAREGEKTLEDLGFVDISMQDATEDDRWILDRDNWIICSSAPAATKVAKFKEEVVLFVVQTNEVCPKSPDSDSGESNSVSPNSTQYGLLTEQQISTLAIIQKYLEVYDKAETDLQKGNARIERDEAICKILKKGKVSNWSGRVKEIGATSEALGWISVQISKDVSLETWNNELSDFQDNTLISRKSPVYKTLLGLKKGQVVQFSGQFVKDSGVCLGTKNLTEYFSMNSPEFLFKFSNVEVK